MIDDFNGKHVIIPALEEEERERMANKPLLSLTSEEEITYPESHRKRKIQIQTENVSTEIETEEKRKNSIALYLIIPGVLVPGLLCWVWMCYLKDTKTFSLKGTRVVIQVFSVFTSIIQCIFVFVFAAVIYLSHSTSK